jgi:hypothetical protein
MGKEAVVENAADKLKCVSTVAEKRVQFLSVKVDRKAKRDVKSIFKTYSDDREGGDSPYLSCRAL